MEVVGIESALQLRRVRRLLPGRRDARRRARGARSDAWSWQRAQASPGTDAQDDEALQADEMIASARAPRARTARGPAFLIRAATADFVYYVEIRGRGVFLRASPIDVSRIVAEALFDRMRTTVLTSATLAVDGSLRLRQEHGSASASADGVARRRRSSTTRGRRCSTCRGAMPPPKSPTFSAAAAREMIEILKRSRGRAFVLFTSYAMLRAVQQFVEMALPYPILVQGTAPRSALHRTVPLDAERRAARDLELLAGRGRRRRRAELRHHRQAAVRLAGRSRSRPRASTRSRRAAATRSPISGAAGDPRAAAGSWPAHPPPDRPRRPGRARPALADHGLWAAISGVAAPGAGHPGPGGGRTFLRVKLRAGRASRNRARPKFVYLQRRISACGPICSGLSWRLPWRSCSRPPRLPRASSGARLSTRRASRLPTRRSQSRAPRVTPRRRRTRTANSCRSVCSPAPTT